MLAKAQQVFHCNSNSPDIFSLPFHLLAPSHRPKFHQYRPRPNFYKFQPQVASIQKVKFLNFEVDSVPPIPKVESVGHIGSLPVPLPSFSLNQIKYFSNTPNKKNIGKKENYESLWKMWRRLRILIFIEFGKRDTE